MKNPRDPNWSSNIAKPAPATETPTAEGQDKGETPAADKAKPKPGLVSEAPYTPLDIDPDAPPGTW